MSKWSRGSKVWCNVGEDVKVGDHKVFIRGGDKYGFANIF